MLEVHDLTVGYDRKNVLCGITQSFAPGMIHTVVGKNGCGKSTLLKALAGLLTPESGCVLLDGVPLPQLLPLERARRISLLTQNRNTPNITAERLVLHGRHPHMVGQRKPSEGDWQAVRSAMERLQVAELRHQNLQNLSGGERQRVYLAMLLAQNTPVLLLDEPTTWLDVEYQLLLMELLRTLREEGKTILMVLHDLNLALQHSDSICVLNGGRIVQSGTPEEMLASGVLEAVFRVRIAPNPFQFHTMKPLD